MGCSLAADSYLRAFHRHDQIAGNTGNNLDLGTFHEAEILKMMLQVAPPAHFDDMRGLALFQEGKRHLLDGHAWSSRSLCRSAILRLVGCSS